MDTHTNEQAHTQMRCKGENGINASRPILTKPRLIYHGSIAGVRWTKLRFGRQPQENAEKCRQNEREGDGNTPQGQMARHDEHYADTHTTSFSGGEEANT